MAPGAVALAVEASALALSDTLQVLPVTPALGSQARSLRLCGSAAGAPVSRGAYILPKGTASFTVCWDPA